MVILGASLDRVSNRMYAEGCLHKHRLLSISGILTTNSSIRKNFSELSDKVKICGIANRFTYHTELMQALLKILHNEYMEAKYTADEF